MAKMKQSLTKQINCDFESLTKNILDQKDTILCVPISISILLKWAIENEIEDVSLLTLEKILIILTMVIYPRSLAGLNLNPNKREQQYQENEVEILLKRLQLKTYNKYKMPRDQADSPKDQYDAPKDQYDAPKDQYDAPKDQADLPK